MDEPFRHRGKGLLSWRTRRDESWDATGSRLAVGGQAGWGHDAHHQR
jgi:hypothetical protein